MFISHTLASYNTETDLYHLYKKITMDHKQFVVHKMNPCNWVHALLTPQHGYKFDNDDECTYGR